MSDHWIFYSFFIIAVLCVNASRELNPVVVVVEGILNGGLTASPDNIRTIY